MSPDLKKISYYKYIEYIQMNVSEWADHSLPFVCKGNCLLCVNISKIAGTVPIVNNYFYYVFTVFS